MRQYEIIHSYMRTKFTNYEKKSTIYALKYCIQYFVSEENYSY